MSVLDRFFGSDDTPDVDRDLLEHPDERTPGVTDDVTLEDIYLEQRRNHRRILAAFGFLETILLTLVAGYLFEWRVALYGGFLLLAVDLVITRLYVQASTEKGLAARIASWNGWFDDSPPEREVDDAG